MTSIIFTFYRCEPRHLHISISMVTELVAMVIFSHYGDSATHFSWHQVEVAAVKAYVDSQ